MKTTFNDCPACGAHLDTFVLSKINNKLQEEKTKRDDFVVSCSLASLTRIRSIMMDGGISVAELKQRFSKISGIQHVNMYLSYLKETGQIKEENGVIIWVGV